MDSPELVSLVNPPTIIIEKTSIKEIPNQFKNKLFIFFSFEITIYNIYLIY